MRHIEMNVQLFKEGAAEEEAVGQMEEEDEEIVIVKSPKNSRKPGMIVEMDIDR